MRLSILAALFMALAIEVPAWAITFNCELTGRQLTLVLDDCSADHSYAVTVSAQRSGAQKVFPLNYQRHMRLTLPHDFFNPDASERIEIEIPNYFEGGLPFKNACDLVAAGGPLPSAPPAEEEPGQLPAPSAPAWEDLPQPSLPAGPPGGAPLLHDDESRESLRPDVVDWQALRLAEARRLREVTEQDIRHDERQRQATAQQNAERRRLRVLERERQRQAADAATRQRELAQERSRQAEAARQHDLEVRRLRENLEAERQRNLAAERLQRLEQERLQQLALAMVRTHARGQAALVAERIVNVYGAQENFTYNLARGINTGYLSANAGLTDQEAFGNGHDDGVQVGQERAIRYAKESAKRKATSLAEAEARRRHRAAVQTGFVDRRIVIPKVSIDAGYLPTYFDFSGKLTEKISALNPDFQRSVNRHMSVIQRQLSAFNRSHDDLPSLKQLFDANGKYWVNEKRFKSDFAYEQWTRQSLGGGFDMTAFETYNSGEKDEFRKAFEKEYGTKMPAKLNDAIHAADNEAFREGLVWGSKIKTAEAYVKGFKAGLAEAVVAYDDIFDEEFRSHYESVFAYWLGFWDVNTEIDARFELVKTDSTELSFLLVGEFINYGGAPSPAGNLSITSDLFDLAAADNIPEIPGHTQLKTQVRGVLTLKKSVLPDTRYVVSVSLPYRARQNVEFTLSFEDMLEQLIKGEVGTPNHKLIQQSICGTIADEWSKNSWVESIDIYKKSLQEPKASYLNRLVLFAQQHPDYDYKDIHDILYGYSKTWWSFWFHYNKRASYRHILSQLPHP